MSYKSNYTTPSTVIDETTPFDRRTETGLTDRPNGELNAEKTRHQATGDVDYNPQNSLPGIEYTDEPDIKHHHRQTAAYHPAASTLERDSNMPASHYNNAEHGPRGAADMNVPPNTTTNTAVTADEPVSGPPHYNNETVISVPVPDAGAGNLREHYPPTKLGAKLVGKGQVKGSPDFHIERMKRGEYLEKLDEGVLGRGKGRDQLVGLVAPEKPAEAVGGE